MSDRLGRTEFAMRRRLLVAGLLLAWGIWGCAASDPNGDSIRDPSEVEILALDPLAPAVEFDSISFYAVFGKGRKIEMFFDSAGVRLERLLRFEVYSNSLYRKPDGTSFVPGDSILITVRNDPARLQFSFEPSGLEFNPREPADLRISYGRALTAVLSEADLAIWHQEQPNSVYYRLDSKVDTGHQEIEADIPGFSKYAVAY